MPPSSSASTSTTMTQQPQPPAASSSIITGAARGAMALSSSLGTGKAGDASTAMSSQQPGRPNSFFGSQQSRNGSGPTTSNYSIPPGSSTMAGQSQSVPSGTTATAARTISHAPTESTGSNATADGDTAQPSRSYRQQVSHQHPLPALPAVSSTPGSPKPSLGKLDTQSRNVPANNIPQRPDSFFGGDEQLSSDSLYQGPLGRLGRSPRQVNASQHQFATAGAPSSSTLPTPVLKSATRSASPRIVHHVSQGSNASMTASYTTSPPHPSSAGGPVPDHRFHQQSRSSFYGLDNGATPSSSQEHVASHSANPSTSTYHSAATSRAPSVSPAGIDYAYNSALRGGRYSPANNSSTSNVGRRSDVFSHGSANGAASEAMTGQGTSSGSGSVQPQNRGHAQTDSTSSTAQQQQQHRRRVSSWTTRSNPGSIYGFSMQNSSPQLGPTSSGDNLPSVPNIPTLSQAHLRPGDRASLLSHTKTLELYRANVKKTNDPEVTYEFAAFMLGIARELGSTDAQQRSSYHSSPVANDYSDENLLSSLNDHSGTPSPDPSFSTASRSSGSSADAPSLPQLTLATPSAASSQPSVAQRVKKRGSSVAALASSLPSVLLGSNAKDASPQSAYPKEGDRNTLAGNLSPTTTNNLSSERKALISEAMALLKRNADRGHMPSQFFLADCYASGVDTRRSSGSSENPPSGAPQSAYPGSNVPSFNNSIFNAPPSLNTSNLLPAPGAHGPNSAISPGSFSPLVGGGAGSTAMALTQSSSSTGSPFNASPAQSTQGKDGSRPDYDKALPLYIAAAKHGHAPSCYRAGQCFENGWGCRRDASKAVQFYRKAAVQSHPEAMYRLGMAELNGELGLKDCQKEGFKWLKRVAELAESSSGTGNGVDGAENSLMTDDPNNPGANAGARACAVQALHEMAFLHERGIDNVVFVDNEYAAELLARASELGFAPSAYKLGECYEYGRMGCPQDSALSIHYYNIAAQQNHKEACFALTAWYLVGSPGVLPQSDTEAYLWAKKAAEQGLSKAEYAVGYFTEVGVGTHRDEQEAISWFKRAAEHGDKRATNRLISLGVNQDSQGRPLQSPLSSVQSPTSPNTNTKRGSAYPIVHGTSSDKAVPPNRKGSASVNGSGPMSGIPKKGGRRKSDADCIVS